MKEGTHVEGWKESSDLLSTKERERSVFSAPCSPMKRSSEETGTVSLDLKETCVWGVGFKREE